MRKKSIITWTIILSVILLSTLVLTRSHPETQKEVAECIGENAILYTQLGCHACETQKKIFGENYQYLNVVDCWFDKELCMDVRYTPTWIINGKKYIGAKNIEELKSLTGCIS